MSEAWTIVVGTSTEGERRTRGNCWRLTRRSSSRCFFAVRCWPLTSPRGGAFPPCALYRGRSEVGDDTFAEPSMSRSLAMGAPAVFASATSRSAAGVVLHPVFVVAFFFLFFFFFGDGGK